MAQTYRFWAQTQEVLCAVVDTFVILSGDRPRCPGDVVNGESFDNLIPEKWICVFLDVCFQRDLLGVGSKPTRGKQEEPEIPFFRVFWVHPFSDKPKWVCLKIKQNQVASLKQKTRDTPESFCELNRASAG